MLYDSYGDIRITINDSIIISSITLPKVKIKEPSKTEPMNYDYIETNYVMNYYYKQLNGQWKLYYLYGESTDDISSYFKEVEKKNQKQWPLFLLINLN